MVVAKGKLYWTAIAMVRDKLLTVRIEEGLRDNFNQWCGAKDLSPSKLLYELIKAITEGRLDPTELVTDTALANRLTTTESTLVQKITDTETALANRLSDVERRLEVVESALASTAKQTVPKASMKVSPSATELGKYGLSATELTEEGLSDKELGEIVGLDKSTLCKYRKGQRTKSEGYKQIMSQWRSKGARWFKKT